TSPPAASRSLRIGWAASAHPPYHNTATDEKKMALDNRLGCFCPHGDIHIEGKPGGPLSGLRFAAKDLFDVEGHVTGAGNPDWLATHEPATATASSVSKLLEAGAALHGKTITDELAYSLAGVNMHY